MNFLALICILIDPPSLTMTFTNHPPILCPAQKLLSTSSNNKKKSLYKECLPAVCYSLAPPARCLKKKYLSETGKQIQPGRLMLLIWEPQEQGGRIWFSELTPVLVPFYPKIKICDQSLLQGVSTQGL